MLTSALSPSHANIGITHGNGKKQPLLCYCIMHVMRIDRRRSINASNVELWERGDFHAICNRAEFGAKSRARICHVILCHWRLITLQGVVFLCSPSIGIGILRPQAASVLILLSLLASALLIILLLRSPRSKPATPTTTTKNTNDKQISKSTQQSTTRVACPELRFRLWRYRPPHALIKRAVVGTAREGGRVAGSRAVLT